MTFVIFIREIHLIPFFIKAEDPAMVLTLLEVAECDKALLQESALAVTQASLRVYLSLIIAAVYEFFFSVKAFSDAHTLPPWLESALRIGVIRRSFRERVR